MNKDAWAKKAKLFGSSQWFSNSSQNNSISAQLSQDNKAAGGPELVEEYQLPEINFVPSGCTPDIDLGAPPYDLNVAERRR